MDAILRVVFWYKDGKHYEMKVAVPPDVADKIHVGGLSHVQVFIDAKITNIKHVLKKPTIEDFIKRG